MIHLRPGDIVFEFGDIGDRMYIVVKGTLEIYLQEDGTQCRFVLLGPGDFFGEMALFTEARRSASVRAVTPALVRPVGRDDMLAWHGRYVHPERTIIGIRGFTRGC